MGRIAAEGRVGSFVSDSCGAMIEVNCETDFVAKNAEFIELTNGLAQLVAEANPVDVDALLATVCPKSGKPVADVIKEKIASIGEKITIRRFVRYEGKLLLIFTTVKLVVLLETDAKE